MSVHDRFMLQCDHCGDWLACISIGPTPMYATVRLEQQASAWGSRRDAEISAVDAKWHVSEEDGRMKCVKCQHIHPVPPYDAEAARIIGGIVDPNADPNIPY